jgi:hypothetical protein
MTKLAIEESDGHLRIAVPWFRLSPTRIGVTMFAILGCLFFGATAASSLGPLSSAGSEEDVRSVGGFLFSSAVVLTCMSWGQSIGTTCNWCRGWGLREVITLQFQLAAIRSDAGPSRQTFPTPHDRVSCRAFRIGACGCLVGLSRYGVSAMKLMGRPSE